MASEAKHTPGPWKARGYSSTDGSIWIDCDAFSKSGKTALGGTLAAAYGTGTGSDDSAVQKANAWLIAAAPELLAALREADDVLEDLRVPSDAGPNRFEQVIPAALAKIRAAIAKAEGA